MFSEVTMAQKIHVIDVKSGNLQSLKNAIISLGDYEIVYIENEADFVLCEPDIKKLFFPGVGNYGHFVKELSTRNLVAPLKKYVESGRLMMGICVGLQAFFLTSEESSDVHGLNFLNFGLLKFNNTDKYGSDICEPKTVPHIGWNKICNIMCGNDEIDSHMSFFGMNKLNKYYFVHSYAAIVDSNEKQRKIKAANMAGWNFSFARYGSEKFLAAMSYKNLFATQFHPEKSGEAGLKVMKAFLEDEKFAKIDSNIVQSLADVEVTKTGLSRRIIACLDVRANDAGDLVVTKGDQYDVRESLSSGESSVRNLGKPVELATKYYKDGADEVTFLNITSFRNSPLKDIPMLEVLKQAAKNIFVPLTVGGGIKDLVEPQSGELFSAAQVADLYFQSGADKVSIGSEAVLIAEEYYKNDKRKLGKSAIETISARFGVQAVVISVDPKRKYVDSRERTNMAVIEISSVEDYGPKGERFCYYQVTSQGGRKIHELGALELCQACEDLGAGEILLNSIDNDGTSKGFNKELLKQVKQGVSIPIIASSGAGNPKHFEEVFKMSPPVDAALGAGIFHRGEYDVNTVKSYLQNTAKLDVRLEKSD